jgi:hypothetical protein
MTLADLSEGKIIRIVDHNSEDSSVPQEITIKRQPSVSEVTTSVTTTAVTGEDKKDGTISISPFGAYPFEYRLLTASDPQPLYKPFDVTPQPGLEAGTYLIRVQAEGEYLASSTYAVSVGSYTKPTKLTVPDDVAFEATGADSGRLVNVGPDLRYSLGTSDTWVAITGDTAVIPSGVSGQILVKAFGNGTTTLDSDIKTIKISQYATPDTKNLVVKDCSISTQNNGTITVYYETPCEYRKEGFTTYTDVKDRFITNLTPGKYYVRFKANGAILASADAEVTVKEYVAPPVIKETKITMYPTTVTLNTTDSSVKLSVTFDPLNTTNQTVTWASSNENVVRVHDSYRTTVGANGVATASVIAVGSGTATIVAQSANGHVAYATVTVQTNYYFTYHKNGTWYYDVGGSYTVQATGPASRLAAVKINGYTLNPYYYTVSTASDGTTIVTISETAMKAMEHKAYQNLQFVYSDGGTASCFLHVLSVRDRPITGDDSNLALWISLMIMSAAAGMVVFTKRKKTVQENFK